MADKKPYEGKAHLFAEGTGLRNLAERNGVEVVDILLSVRDALEVLKEEDGRCDHTFKRCKHMINVCTKCGVEGEMD